MQLEAIGDGLEKESIKKIHYNPDYEYLNKLSLEELKRVVQGLFDYEEVAEAYRVLLNRDLNIAIEHGVDILINNKGDEYLQAIIWGDIFDRFPEKALSIITKRKAKLSPTVLAEIIRYTTISKTKLDDKEIKIIEETYENFDKEVQRNMMCNYDLFVTTYK